MALTEAQIRRLAPEVRLHPRERYFPTNPIAFVRASRFRHHRDRARDRGYNKTTTKWRTTNSHNRAYYNIPVAFINSFKVRSNGKNRRPRDGNSGRHWNVFLQTRNRMRGTRRPTGRIPVFYYQRREGAFDLVSYWWFLGFNDGQTAFDMFNHQGDWEHVTLKVRRGRIRGVWFSQHGVPKYRERSKLKWHNRRVVVYCAKSTHASYEKTGSFRLGVDDTAEGGVRWFTWRHLLPLRDQPWKDFAGAWGEVGALPETTGPLGPWPRRRRK